MIWMALTFVACLVGALLMRAPEEKSSQGAWALLRRFTIRCPGGRYLDRVRIVQTPWFAVWLHRIARPDADRHLHDHPRSFLSIVLRGGYVEEVPIFQTDWKGRAPTILNVVRWSSFKRAKDLHRIVDLWRSGAPTWTLVFCGPLRRRWGFATEVGWLDHEAYFLRRDLEAAKIHGQECAP